MAERIYLDPSELGSGRTELEITPWVKVDGIDWGDGDLEAFRSQSQYGESVVDTRYPNRQITVPLVLRTLGGTTFATIRSAVQAKAAIWQREGGGIKRITSTGGTLYADVQMSGLKLSGDWLQATKDADIEAVLSAEVSPDFYGNEITLADHVETSATELVFTETSVSGDYPARVRILVDEDQGQAQLGLMWGVRRRNYSSAATARLQYEAEALQPLDTAARAALTGASGGTVVTHGTLSTNWTPVLSMNMAGTAYLTHVGSYRWWCRYRTTSGTAVQLRGVYDVGDLVNPEENARWTHPASTFGTSFYDADLGQIRLDQTPVGTHRWTGQIQGKGDLGGENVSIDRVWFQPLDESAGVLRASSDVSPGLANYSDRDEFNQTAGALAAKTSSGGKVWAGAGDAVDFAVETTGKTAQRTELSDVGTMAGARVAISGAAAFATQAVQVDFKISTIPLSDTRPGVVARYVDINNQLAAYINVNSGNRGITVEKRVASTDTVIAGASDSYRQDIFAAETWFTIRLLVDALGRYFVWFGLQGSQPALILSGVDTDLATGGTLASGKPGFRDMWGAATAGTRNYKNFAAWPPTPDAVLNPSQSAELRWDGIVREDTGGTAYGPVSWIEGDLPRLPPTLGGTTEVFLKASRGDFQSLPDTAIDDLSARITYRPCWLHPNS